MKVFICTHKSTFTEGGKVVGHYIIEAVMAPTLTRARAMLRRLHPDATEKWEITQVYTTIEGHYLIANFGRREPTSTPASPIRVGHAC